MRNLKRVLALALALVMMLGMMITANAASYTDAAAIDANYTEAIDVLSGMGVFKGQGANNFAPKAVLTRAEASALIYRVLTGDVTDAQKVNYNYSSFDDVTAGQWFTGYVTYAANGGYIKGDGTGNFNPNDVVTGVQVMAIMLRAAGYGQNGEYEGAGWMDNVLTDAKELGITGTIATSTLIAPATREVVAQLIFNALTEAVMVTYTPAMGYLPVTWLNGNINQATLGYKVFGLIEGYGIVVGNQATGETATKIQMETAAGYVYSYANAVPYDTTTDLDLFGHAVKVWYNDHDNIGAVQTYAVFDKATNVAVVEAKTNAAAYAAGFDIPVALKNSQATAAAAYCNDGYGATYWAGGPASSYPIYVMISNSADKSLDLVIGVDASVRLVTAVNNYIANPTVSLSTIGTIARAKITSGVENAIVGNYVIVNEITGTANTKTATMPYYALDTVTQAKSGKIIYVATNGDVTLADGTKVEKSPLYDYSDMTKASLVAGVELTFALDNQGKYIGVTQPRAEWLYTTYTYWEQTGTSTITYYVQGVTPAGEITTITVDKDAYDYLNDTISYKNYGTDTVVAKNAYKMAKIIDSKTVPGAKTVDTSASWTDTIAQTLTAKSDKIDGQNNIFLSEATVYHVVKGFGDTLTVTPYTGVNALLNGATSVAVNGVYSKVSLSTITTQAYNYIVTNALIGAPNYTFTGNYFYGGNGGDPAPLAASGYNANVKLYNLYVAGEAAAAPVWVNTADGATPADNTFYTYTKTYDRNLGADVYTLTADMNNGAGSGYSGLTLTQATYSAQGYVAVDDWANDPQYNAADAKIVDLTSAKAITGIAALLEAVQQNDVVVDCLFDAKENITVIYVIGVTQA